MNPPVDIKSIMARLIAALNYVKRLTLMAVISISYDAWQIRMAHPDGQAIFHLVNSEKQEKPQVQFFDLGQVEVMLYINY